MPTISYPPLSEEPFDSFSHYDQVIGNHESHDPYRGILKYYNTSPYRGERSLPFDSRNSNTSSMEESPVGVTPFNPISIYPPNHSLLGDLRSESSASSLSDDGLGALEQITLSREPDVYTDEDMEFSMVSGGDDEEDRSGIGETKVTLADQDKNQHLNRGEDINGVTGSQPSFSQERPQTPSEDTHQITQQTKTDEDETAFFSEPEYDSQAKETVDITTIYDIRKEIKITAKPHGEALDTIDENSQSSYSQFDDDESMASSYLFSLVDDDTDLLKMKRRRRMGSHRKGRRRRQQQPQGPLFSPSLMNEESPDFVVNDEPVTRVAEDTVTGSDDAYVSQGCCSLSFTQMKQDVKTTYVDAARALNQVLYAFFVEKEDISAMTEKVQCAKFKGQGTVHSASDDGQFSQRVLV